MIFFHNGQRQILMFSNMFYDSGNAKKKFGHPIEILRLGLFFFFKQIYNM